MLFDPRGPTRAEANAAAELCYGVKGGSVFPESYAHTGWKLVMRTSTGHRLYRELGSSDVFVVQRAGHEFPGGNFSGWDLATMINLMAKLPTESEEKMNIRRQLLQREESKRRAKIKNDPLVQYVRDRGLISVRKMAKIMNCYIEDITDGM